MHRDWNPNVLGPFGNWLSSRSSSFRNWSNKQSLYWWLTKPKDPIIPENKYNGIQLQKSSYGDAIPLIYGQQRIAPTLGWYGNFKSIPHTDTSGGGKGGNQPAPMATLTYSASFLGMLCEGQIAGIGTVWKDKDVTTTSAVGLTVFTGAGGQAAWSYLTTNFPSQAIPYDHTAYIAVGDYDLGDSAGMPNLSFEVQGLLQYGGGIVDCDPSVVLVDYCTNFEHGANFNALGTLTNWQNYCISLGLFVSPFETSQRPAVEFIRELLRVTNSEAFDSAGTLQITPYCDQPVSGNAHSYSPNMTPLFAFTDDDFLATSGQDPVTVDVKSKKDTVNCVRVEYLDRSNNYNTAIAEAKDDQDVALYGLRVGSTITLHMITQASVARLVAQLILQRQLYLRNIYQFKLGIQYSILEPMDLVSITDSVLGLNNQLVRITEVDEAAIAVNQDGSVNGGGEITITAEHVDIGVANSPLYNWQLAQGYAANFGVAPGSVQTPQIFMGVPLLIDAGGGYEIWIAVSGPSASATWGGCNVYMSFDNVNYRYIGESIGAARYGTTTASLATGGDPDNVHTLSVQLNNTSLVMNSGTVNDADFMRTICLVENEIVSYETATLTGAGAYNLTYLRRGKYGTAIASHSGGVRFVRLDQAIFRMPCDPGWMGQTIYFKFQSFNLYQGGLESMASLTAYSFVPSNPNAAAPFEAGLTLVPRGSCVVVGTSIYKKTSGASAWDSDCYSEQAYSNGCALSFSANQTNLALMIGLNTDPVTDQNYTSIDFAFQTNSDGNAYIYESGTLIGGSLGAYTTATVFRIEYDGQTVKYFLDGVLQRQIEKRAQTFFLDSSFKDPGAAVKNVSFTTLNAAPSIPFIARGNCVATATTIKKNGGSSAWDSDCYSYEAYANGCTVSFQPEDTTSAFMIGLNTDPTTNQNYTSLDYTWYMDAGTAEIYESGVGLGAVGGSYTTNDQFSIVYDGRYVRYLKNGLILRQVYQPDQTFFMDSSFNTPGGAARNVYFNASGAATPAPFIARGNCVVSDDNIRKEGGSSAWDSDCYSINGYPNCHLVFKANETNKQCMVGLNTDPTTDQSYTSIDYAWYAHSDGNAYIYESGSLIGGSRGAYTTATVFSIICDGSNLSYLLDGIVILTRTGGGFGTLFMDSSFYDPGRGINSLRFGPTTNLAVMDTPQIGSNAATIVFQDYHDFAGAGFGTATARSFSIAPQYDCIVEFTAVIGADSVLPDSGNKVEWYYNIGGGDILLGFCNADSTARQSFPMSTSFSATAGVTITFNLKVTKSGATIHLFQSDVRVTQVKK